MKRLFLIFALLLLCSCSSIDKKEKTEISNKEKIMTFYKEWKGTKYKLGGTSKKGVDCSALMQNLFKEEFGISLPRTTATQVKEGTKISRSDLKSGDLIFFKIKRNVRHVAVYIGNNKFIHASTSSGVVISEFNNYWNKKYWQSRRIL